MKRVRNVYTPDQVPARARRGLPFLVKAVLGAVIVWFTLSIWIIALGGG